MPVVILRPSSGGGAPAGPVNHGFARGSAQTAGKAVGRIALASTAVGKAVRAGTIKTTLTGDER